MNFLVDSSPVLVPMTSTRLNLNSSILVDKVIDKFTKSVYISTVIVLLSSLELHSHPSKDR